MNRKCIKTNLCSYNHDANKNGKTVYSEENYNAAIPNWNGNYICLDQTNISPTGHTNIEPCDIYSIEDDASSVTGIRALFYHIKISTRSAKLSHLFAQGVTAIRTIQMDETSRSKMKRLIAERVPKAERYLTPIDGFDFKVIFGVITHKDSEGQSENLPLFSRINLMQAMQNFDLMRVPSQANIYSR